MTEILTPPPIIKINDWVLVALPSGYEKLFLIENDM